MATTGTTGVRTPSVEAILNALRQHPDATAAKLAEAAGIGRSTAAKTLATLEAEGRVVRQRGTPRGGKAAPDHWTLAPDPRSNHSDPDPAEPPAARTVITTQRADTTKIPVAEYEEWVYTTNDYYYHPQALTDVQRLQHNVEVLNAWLGLSADDVAALKKDGVL